MTDSTTQQSGVIVWFISNPVAANLLMIMIILAGLISAGSLRIEGFPTVDPDVISIDVTYESGDARQAEEGIAIKIEEALLGTPGIKTLTTTSNTNGASVRVEKKSGYELGQLNTDIKNKVDGIFGFPVNAEKPIVSQQQWEETAVWIAVFGEANQHQLQTTARQFENALLALPSITKVTRSGWRKPEIAIEIDEQTLQAYQLTLNDIAERINQESLSATSGELRSENGTILLKADKQGYLKSDFEHIVVRTLIDGSTVLLSDIAKVTDGFEETPNTLSRFNGKPAIMLEVQISRDANIVAIAEDAQTLLDEWQTQNRLPANVDLKLWMNQSLNMLDRLGLMINNGLIGIALVMILLTIFLNVKVAFWVGMGLPVCFAGGLLMMSGGAFDLTLNQLTTFGFVLVLGILVDDAVVVGESVYSAHQKHGSSVNSTVIGVRKVAIPTMFGVLTTVAAFYPLTFVDGRLGQLFAQFALVCTACLIFSLIESKLILPAHLRHIDTNRKPSNNLFSQQLAKLQSGADKLIINFNQKVYRPAVKQALHFRYAVVAAFVSVFVLVVGMIPSGKIGFEFFPEIPEEVLTITYSAKPGVGYGLIHRKAHEIEQAIVEVNQYYQKLYPNDPAPVRNFYSLIANDTSGSTSVELTPDAQRQADVMEIVEKLEEKLPLTAGLQELLIAADDWSEKDIELKILSNDRTEMADPANTIVEALNSLSGVKDIFNDQTSGLPQLSFELTPEGRALGMTTDSLAQQIQQAFYGALVQRIQRGKDEVRVRVRYPAEQRKDITSIQQARVRTPTGEVVPLSAVASIFYGNASTDINRKDGIRTATVSANAVPGITTPESIFERIEEDVFPQLKARYPDMQFFADGDAAEEEESSESLLTIFGFSLLMIYILVAIPLKSYWQPVIIMSVIPFAIVGAILGHWFMGLPVSLLSIFGILALSGVVVNDSLLLVNCYNDLRRHHVDIKVALEEAGSQRMRAILLTTVTTCLGLVSLLQETSEQAQFLIPPATSLAFGICFATLISLILVPVLLAIAADIKLLVKPQQQPAAELAK